MIPKKKRLQRDFLLQLPGYLLVCSFITAALSGLLIAFCYIPTPTKAALSISYIQEKVFAGTSVITIHRLSSILTIIFTLLNLIIILPSKKKSTTWIRIWQSGIVLITLFIFFRITGYLLSGSNSSAYLLQSLYARFSSTESSSTSLSALFDNLPVAFIRVYLLHIIILPGLAGFVLYWHIRGMKQLGADLQPMSIPPTTILAVFITLLIVVSIFIKPIDNTIPHYTENYLANSPWIIQFLVQIKRLLSLPIALIMLLLLFIIALSLGNVIKKYKNKDSHKDTKSEAKLKSI